MDTKLVVILGAIGVGCAWVNGYMTGSITRGRQERKTLQQVIDGKWTTDQWARSWNISPKSK